MINLPSSSSRCLESGIVESSAHHCRHAGRSVEEIEEGLLRDVIEVHFFLWVV